MKIKALLSLAVVSALLLFSSCEDDDKIQPSDVSGAISQSAWKITYFQNSTQVETGNFNNYNFTFTITPNTTPASGLIEASNGSTDVVGSWATGYIGGNAKLKLNFGLSPFDELNADWEVTEVTSTVIKLKRNGGNDNLTFESI